MIVLFGAMATLLVGVGQLFNKERVSPSETEKLRHKLRSDESVISKQSVFHDFLAKTIRK